MTAGSSTRGACVTKAGEVDAVAEKAGVLSIIEIKSRPSLAEAAIALTARQQSRLVASCEIILAEHPEWGSRGVRFDVVVVNPAGQMRRIADAFQAQRSFQLLRVALMSDPGPMPVRYRQPRSAGRDGCQPSGPMQRLASPLPILAQPEASHHPPGKITTQSFPGKLDRPVGFNDSSLRTSFDFPRSPAVVSSRNVLTAAGCIDASDQLGKRAERVQSCSLATHPAQAPAPRRWRVPTAE